MNLHIRNKPVFQSHLFQLRLKPDKQCRPLKILLVMCWFYEIRFKYSCVHPVMWYVSEKKKINKKNPTNKVWIPTTPFPFKEPSPVTFQKGCNVNTLTASVCRITHHTFAVTKSVHQPYHTISIKLCVKLYFFLNHCNML